MAIVLTCTKYNLASVGPLIIPISLPASVNSSYDTTTYLHHRICGQGTGHSLVSIEEEMRARAKRLPGQPGTKALLKTYGDRLICVRYRYDRAQRKRYKTVELIVEEAPWEPRPAIPAPDAIVYIRVAWGEAALARRIKDAGGQWRRDYKLWALRYAQVEQLDLLDRMVEPDVE